GVRGGAAGMVVVGREAGVGVGRGRQAGGRHPAKGPLHTADVLEQTRHGAEVGVATREVRLELAAAMKHKEKVVRQSSNGVSFLMKKNKVDVVNGFGRIAFPGRVSVAGADGAETSYSARNIL